VQVGDRFWCKEAWAHDAPDDETFKACHQDAYSDDYSYGPYYKATAEQFDVDSLHWKPARYMPKYACRLLLRVTRIRIQRLQEISEADCYAEGCQDMDRGCMGAHHVNGEIVEEYEPIESVFQHLWNSIHKDKPGRSWDDDPWVIAYSLERVER
jgi:hypothetical protein